MVEHCFNNTAERDGQGDRGEGDRGGERGGEREREGGGGGRRKRSIYKKKDNPQQKKKKNETRHDFILTPTSKQTADHDITTEEETKK